MIHRVLRRWLPSAQTVRSNRALSWLAPVLGQRWLWRVDSRGLALGIAAGVFFGLLIPLAQIPLAAAAAYVMRANLPVAVVGTLISNPFTYVPLYLLAHHIGAGLLGVPSTLLPDALHGAGGSTWWEYIAGIGKPLAVGLLTLAVTATVAAYIGMRTLWRIGVALQALRLKRRASARFQAKDLRKPG